MLVGEASSLFFCTVLVTPEEHILLSSRPEVGEGWAWPEVGEGWAYGGIRLLRSFCKSVRKCAKITCLMGYRSSKLRLKEWP